MEKQLKNAIRAAADELICETHPEVCHLRDNNYNRLEELVIDRLAHASETVSVQTALAEIEQELAHA